MDLDIITVGLIISVIGSIVFASLELYRHRQLDLVKIGAVFLAVYAIVPSIELIIAGIEGKTEALPSHWREYLTIAGVIGFLSSVNFLFRKFFQKPDNNASKQTSAHKDDGDDGEAVVE